MNRIQYRFETVDEDIPVWFDSVQIRKVFNNLLSNAFKFTPKEGNITVSILRKKEFAEIRISDTGSGIPQSQQAHIFERFYQADNATGLSLSGSGIGLALTQEIIMQQKGDIWVKSELGEGTTFTVTLPLGDEHLASEQKSAEPQPVDMLPVQEAKPEEAIAMYGSPEVVPADKITDKGKAEKSLSVPPWSFPISPKNSSRAYMTRWSARTARRHWRRPSK